jgi:hypothetical protein
MPLDPALVTADWNAPPAEPVIVRVTKALSIWRAVFSFPVMLSLALTVLTVLTVRNRFDDPDLWWHFKATVTWPPESWRDKLL